MFGLGKKISGGDPRAFRQEIGGAWGGYMKTNDGLASGLVAGTLVATQMGWRPVEAIAEGDLVLTFDNGMQPVRSVTRGSHWRTNAKCPQSLWPFLVPVGALGNKDELLLLPEQQVLVESETADLLLDDPFTLLCISDLDGYRGIEQVAPRDDIRVIQLTFDADEVVFAAAGALVHCANVQSIDMTALMSANPAVPNYRALSGEEAALLVDCLIEEDSENSMSAAPVREAYCAA